jgi:hypothetical protein
MVYVHICDNVSGVHSDMPGVRENQNAPFQTIAFLQYVSNAEWDPEFQKFIKKYSKT